MELIDFGPNHLGKIHSALIRGFLAHGFCPSRTSLGNELNWSPEDIEAGLRVLELIHGVVLHPHIPDPWVVHPFSMTPTLNYVAQGGKGWWAPCVWCALGIELKDGAVIGNEELVIHFSIPPRDAWKNFHAHCAYVLSFRSKEQVAAWCGQHDVTQGEAVPVGRVKELANYWYGPYASPDWQKWTVVEAQEIFNKSGLTSALWQLSGGGIY